MDQVRFDQFVQLLGTARSRRSAIGAGLAALLPVAALSDRAPVAAKKRKPKPKQCGPCEVRKGQRKCKPAPDNKRCQGDGRCLRGKCNPRPTCGGFNASCSANRECCSGTCEVVLFGCFASGVRQRCVADSDCSAGTCVGYRCRA